LEENLVKKFFRFRSRVDLGSNQFEEVEVDVNNHLHFTNLKEVKDQDEKTTLTDHLSNFLNIPLNMVILGNNFSIFRNFLFG
jgi:hypothetical protein